jgi:predicted nucleic acid-binding protein
MLLIDTSVWIQVFRDKTGKVSQQLQNLIDDREIFLTRFTQLELLQGCRDQKEWVLLNSYLQVQDYIDLKPESWEKAARIYYDLRRQGLTVRSSIDCCIAQVAIENQLLLVHIDRDFETISQIASLNQVFLQSAIA